jgi:gamma-glutamylcyclotransferase (GGCT)/AIG2-like uncharacterized protein YtfP
MADRKKPTYSGSLESSSSSGYQSDYTDCKYYFAYGSNMSLKQMAERCPSSLFMGKGRIDGYRWQINERGVANIVESGRDFVEGLVYQIDAEDKRQLDLSEGVARGFYNDEHLHTQFLPLPNRGIKTFHVAKELEMDDQPPSRYPTQESSEMVEALVYVSFEYKDDGSIRSEYIARMEKAITDGRKMGLSDRYLNHIDRTIHQEVPPRQNNDAFRTSYGLYERMETGGASHEPYEILESTRQRLEQYERVPTIRPSYPSYVNMITVQPRYQDFHDLDGNVVYREIRYADERPYRPRCDTERQSETRERRRNRSPTRSRQSRGRDERSGAGLSRLVPWRYHIGGRSEQAVERRRRSSSTPY